MVHDKRYKAVKALIESGHIKTFHQVFDHIPKTVVAYDFGTTYIRFAKLLANPKEFKLIELEKIAALFDIPILVIINMIVWQSFEEKK